MKLRWLLIPALAMLGWYMSQHPYGDRFAIGTWPVPPGTPWTYQLESGFVPALTVLSLLGTVAGLWHSVNCHKRRCWRIGRHKVDGTPWCDHHHGEAREKAAATLEDVVARLDSLLAVLGKGDTSA
jgi:hypothetical protein